MAEESWSIGFRTTGEWSANELVVFSSSVRDIYDGLLCKRVRARLENNYLASWEEALQRYSKLAGHPLHHELFHLWREVLHVWRKERSLSALPMLPPPFGFGFPDIASALPSDEELFNELNRYTSSGDRLQVRQARIASPGGFSFTGIGEIVGEFRELIKDLWFRNRQERALGDLEVLEKYLTIRAEHPDVQLPPPPYLRKDRFLAELLTDRTRQLKELEDRGKLEAVTQNLDYAPLE